MRVRWTAMSLWVLVATAGCHREPDWRLVTSQHGLYTFEFPDGWQVAPSDDGAIVTYRNPSTRGEFTLSGYWGVEDAEILNAAWSSVAGPDRAAGEWKRRDGVGWHRWEQRFVQGDRGTDLVVIWGETKKAVVVTLIDSVEALDDNKETYRHMLDSVQLNPYAKRAP